jgi:hypothetical protein
LGCGVEQADRGVQGCHGPTGARGPPKPRQGDLPGGDVLVTGVDSIDSMILPQVHLVYPG